jgi:hypothetical protein
MALRIKNVPCPSLHNLLLLSRIPCCSSSLEDPFQSGRETVHSLVRRDVRGVILQLTKRKKMVDTVRSSRPRKQSQLIRPSEQKKRKNRKRERKEIVHQHLQRKSENPPSTVWLIQSSLPLSSWPITYPLPSNNLIPPPMRLQIHHPNPLKPLHNPPHPFAKLRQPTSGQRFLRTTSSPHALRTANRTQAPENVALEALEQHFEHRV